MACVCMQRRIGVLVGVAAGFAVFGGAAGASSAGKGPRARSASVNVSAPRRAIQTARASVAGVPYSIDRARGGTAWEVELVGPTGRARERLISGDGSQVIGRSTSPRPSDAGRARQANVGLRRALQIASGRASGRLEGADPDRERGQNVWTVAFMRAGGETEVHVSIRTGQVVKVEHD